VQELQKLKILTTNNSLFFSILFFQTTRIPLVLRLGEMREDTERERERAAEGFKFAAGCFDKMQQDGCEIYKSESMFGKSRRSARIIVILSQSSV
jgi:hypothetical protein